ncbi:MAG: AAA family ATPase [Candidatus Omnitrophica bacterium]|nr:AAA family ATPase [Candidatus Omnitrophota bacterium]
MDRHEQRVVRFLSKPSAYPHRAPAVARRETHVSHVFLAGPFAYKLKKPVKFPFLDASTLARRRRFCGLELSLNRRLAPAVYLGMVPIVETPAGLRLGPSTRPSASLGTSPGRDGAGLRGHERIIEWVVKMRRLPEERMLDQVVARRQLTRGDMLRIADRLSRFFRRAARGPAIARYGAPDQVAALVLGNLDECRPFVGRLFSESDHLFLKAAYRQYLALHEPLLARRAREGRIIDGHGDLRCENICLPAAPKRGMKRGAAQAGLTSPVIFDCVEFQPAFRCGDMANDFSFLVMDLEFRGRADLADALVAGYRRRLGDATLAQVLPFYKCHRSLVRGKVRALAWSQHPRTARGRRVRALSRRHFQLAARYARAFAPPRLVAVGGLIGTGKSTLARALAQALGASWLRTDEIRLREFARAKRRGQGFAQGLYAPHISELVYRRLLRRAETLVREGGSVICDGTFSKAAGRAALREIARRHGGSFHFFECVVPRAVALRRVARRYAARADLSEARPEHYDRLRAGFEPRPRRGWPRRDWTRLSDNRAPQATAAAALAALRRAWSQFGG